MLPRVQYPPGLPETRHVSEQWWQMARFAMLPTQHLQFGAEALGRALTVLHVEVPGSETSADRFHQYDFSDNYTSCQLPLGVSIWSTLACGNRRKESR